ncbi:hypothetical protein Tco_0838627 [Tanacetum coccineum]|uniref:Uncharacterized protein n=1 Tax=Tanacetum coccineum TaxID=301880 RepID=A0ABQ5ANB6_9ASTR
MTIPTLLMLLKSHLLSIKTPMESFVNDALTLPSVHPTCNSEDENSFTYDSKPNFVDDSPNFFNPPPQPYLTPIYSCEFCRNDARYGHYCTPQVPFIYPSESEDASDGECDLPPYDDSLKNHDLTFSNPLFDIDEDFTSSDESFSEEDVPNEKFNIFSNPLFDLDKEITSTKVDQIDDEVLENTNSIPPGIEYPRTQSQKIKAQTKIYKHE